MRSADAQRRWWVHCEDRVAICAPEKGSARRGFEPFDKRVIHDHVSLGRHVLDPAFWDENCALTQIAVERQFAKTMADEFVHVCRE